MASKHHSTSVIHLDGTTLEGGGQLFRLALSLSAITRKAIHITDIRGKRGAPSRPGEAGGIKPAHHAGATWLTRATKARTVGLEVKSREIVFDPSLPLCILETGEDPDQCKEISNDEGGPTKPGDVWKDVIEAGKLVRRETSISMKTPGSVYLVLQAILPYILFSSATNSISKGSTSVEPVPLRISIEGGTNVWHSLSHEYADQVLFPILHHNLGLGTFNLTLHKRGWSTGRNSIGSIQLDISPQTPGTLLPTFFLTDRGEISAFHVSILAPDTAWRTGIRDFTTLQLLQRWLDVEISFPVDDFSGHEKRIYLLIVAESENGYRLGRDWLYDEKISKDKPKRTIERIVKKVLGDLEQEIKHGGCVDEWLQDQLVVFQALAEGKSIVEGGEPSLHTRTARWVAENVLDIEFNKSGRCRGVGFTAGRDFGLEGEKDIDRVAKRGNVAELVDSVEIMQL